MFDLFLDNFSDARAKEISRSNNKTSSESESAGIPKKRKIKFTEHSIFKNNSRINKIRGTFFKIY